MIFRTSIIICILIMLPNLIGCYKYESYVSPSSTFDAHNTEVRELIVETVDNRRLTFYGPIIRHDSLIGSASNDEEERVPMGIPLAETRSMRVKKFDWLKSSVFVIGSFVILRQLFLWWATPRT